MDAAGTLVGIASLGIQVCQSLLSYYDGWKQFHQDIQSAYSGIADLAATFSTLESALLKRVIDDEQTVRIRNSLSSCEDGLARLQKRLEKLRKHSEPQGLRQRTWAELQRAWYPLRASTLAKLKETVMELRDNLSLALQVVQLDLGVESSKRVVEIETYVRSVSASTKVLENSVLDVRDQTETIAAGVANLLSDRQRAKHRDIVDWLAAPDTSFNDNMARKKHEPGTGDWLYESYEYLQWLSSQNSVLWCRGKAGCGKTVLCSTVIDKFGSRPNGGPGYNVAFFYFSFSDTEKQTYTGFLSSLVAQLSRNTTLFEKLEAVYDKHVPNRPSSVMLEHVLADSLPSMGEVVVIIDALDEASESDDGRREVLRWLNLTRQQLRQFKVFATSRQLSDIESSMASMAAQIVSIRTDATNSDIRKYVQTEIEGSDKLRSTSPEVKLKIKDALESKSDGMFRWAFCQMEELKRLKSTKPKYIEQVLCTLPATLDATYERMLIGIDEMYRAEALIALRWIVFEPNPLTLCELVEACIIDYSGPGSVDYENRGQLEDIPEILSGLVMIESATDNIRASVRKTLEAAASPSPAVATDTESSKSYTPESKVRLAHFSVKEYLVSKRILDGHAAEFAFSPWRDQPILAQSCLVYLIDYSKRPLCQESAVSTKAAHLSRPVKLIAGPMKRHQMQDFFAFPLLERVVASWALHCPRNECLTPSRELELLGSTDHLYAWILFYKPEHMLLMLSQGTVHRLSKSAIYYASELGLLAACKALLQQGADPNAQGIPEYDNALQAAAHAGHVDVVELLISHGADPRTVGGRFGSALHAAIMQGHTQTARSLINSGADLCAIGMCGTALQAAAFEGHTGIVKLLLDMGADVTSWVPYGTALQGAVNGGHREIVDALLDSMRCDAVHENDVHEAINLAIRMEREEILDILVRKGAGIMGPSSR